MVRGIQRLIDDIRNPRASKKRRKKKIDDLPDLPFFPKFKAPPITKAAKELAKIMVDLGPEAGKPRIFDDTPRPNIIVPHRDNVFDRMKDRREQERGRQKLRRKQQEQRSKVIRRVKTTVKGREPMTMEDDMRELFDRVDDLEGQRLSDVIYEEAERTQNQEMEDALSRIEARRPRQFTRSRQFSRSNLMPAPKKKRKVSAYQKRFGVELKKLKKLHPRTKIQNLMKRAHRRTRAAMKKK